MRVLLAGASGFIGKNILLRLPADWDTLPIYRSDDSILDFVANRKVRALKPFKCDFLDTKQLSQLSTLGEFDICIYLAGNSNPWVSLSDPQYDLSNGPLALLNLLKSVKMQRLIYLSSGAVYDGLRGPVSPSASVSPRLPYAISKLASELYIQSLSRRTSNPREFVIIRFFDAYGPYEKPRRIFRKLIDTLYFSQDQKFEIKGDGTNLIDAMYVEEAVRGIMATCEGHGDVTVDLYRGDPLTIDELVARFAKVFQISNLEISHVGEPVEPIYFWSECTKMSDLFGFRPALSLKDGVHRYLQFLQQQSQSQQ